jgi:outer membrane protein assembly factor BamB
MRRRWIGSCVAALAISVMATGCGGGDSGTSTHSSDGRGSAPPRVDWPYFGRVPERTNYVADAPDPPFAYAWVFFAHQLIEFPPALAGDRMFVVNKTGQVYALDTARGKVRWQRKLGKDVTGPAYADGTVFIAQLDGDFVALDAETGKRRWTFASPSHLESSPVAIGDRVYFGSDRGILWALDARSGKVAWKTELGAPIKASPAYHDGVLYVGDYRGRIHAVSASDGDPRWSRATGSQGGFYSSPAIAFGHVYEARDDGRVFALTLGGRPAWQFTADDAMYSSPAVGTIPRAGPMVFVGSYDHRLYALDAESGKRRWSHDIGGQIPGSPAVIGTTVYTSSFDTSRTVGLDARNGEPVWEWGSAGYEPTISDGRRVFLIGFQTIWAFDDCAPKDEPSPGAPASLPACHRSADRHLIDVARALRLDSPHPAAAR